MQYLIVVARNEPALYEHLRARHRGDPRVRVVVDRRGGSEPGTTAGTPPVERRRRRSWLASGAPHELVELAREDAAESPSPTQQSSVPTEEAPVQMSDKEILEDPQRVTRWVAESQQMLGAAIPALIEERDRLRQTLEAKERECERLQGETDALRLNLGALQIEFARLRGEREAMAETFSGVVGLVGEVQRPLDELARRLRLVQPVAVDRSAV
jgi:hypothetical protein